MRHISVGVPISLGAATYKAAEFVEGWVRLAIVIIGGFFTIMAGWMIYRAKRFNAIAARMDMCRQCQQLNGGPKNCSVPPEDRPSHCPASGCDLLPH